MNVKAFPNLAVMMIKSKNALLLILLVLIHSITTGIMAQKILPINPETGKIYYSGNRDVKPRCKKKIYKRTEAWASDRQGFPPAVFSISKSAKDTLWIKVVTEVPSIKHLHPISFDTRIIVGSKNFQFTAQNFYFEDINLSLETWVEKFENSSNERHIKNTALITKGLDSHVFLTIENLKRIINNQKAE